MAEKCKFRFLAFAWLIFTGFTSLSAQQLPPYPKMSNAAADDMVSTYAFYVGQVYSVQMLAQKFPALAPELTRAQYKFDSSFKASVDNIDSILRIENTRWAADKAKFLDLMKEKIDLTNVTLDQAKAFIVEVSARAEGKISSPFLETLLMYKPDFLRQPGEELIRGHKRTFSTKNHPKSKGVNFHIEYPISWKAKEGVRPNVISMFKSENGRGFESCLLMVKELPISEAEKLSETEIREVFSQNSMKQMVPANARFVSSVPIKIDGLPGAAIIFDLEAQQLDIVIKTRNLHFAILYKNKIIFVQCTVAGSQDEANNLPARFKRFEPLFRLIANSLVVQSRW